ncbi:MAG: NUDIX hydrolase, partial [Armatimonadetes bacterium]|nr:NUDIX hydrolase [Candidatus Hippobium faecium]
MKKDKVLNSEIVFSGKIFDIKKDTVLLENGREARRDILVHKGACAGVPITEDNKIILVKQYRHATGDFLLEIPAGGLEIGEDPKDCIVRELQEEIGYKPETVEFLYQIWLAPGYSEEKLYCYVCKNLKKSLLPCDDDENIEIYEFAFDEIEKMIMKGEIKDAKTIAC